jgi:secreted trypsin-like serine protease
MEWKQVLSHTRLQVLSHTRWVVGLFVLSGLLPLTTSYAQYTERRVTPKVINGDDAPQGGYSWMVALLRADKSDSTEAHFCGGTLIGSQHILTAAHCLLNDFDAVISDPREIEVSIGLRELPYDRGVRHKVRGFKIHPSFNRQTIENDIAIIKLAMPVSNQPLAVARQNYSELYAPGTEAKILGWGMTDPQLPILPTILQEALVPIQSDRTCIDEIGRWYKPSSMLCAGVKASNASSDDGIDSCKGDSGGPLIVSDGAGGNKLVGITSWGLGCASPKVRGVYAEVAPHEDFTHSFPDAPPMPQGSPTVVGVNNMGSVSVDTPVTCSPPPYLGDEVVSYSYQWYLGTDQAQSGTISVPGLGDLELITDARSPTYTPQVTQLGRRLVCSVFASNAGGDSEARFSMSFFIAESQVTPEVTATPNTNTTDTKAPRVSIKKIACDERNCSALVEAEDLESGISTITAVVEFAYQGRCGQGRRCSKSKIVPVSMKALDRTSWRISFRRSPRPQVRARLIVSATDHAGNTIMTEATKRLRRR